MTFLLLRAACRDQPRPTPGPALPDGWPTRANGEPLLADPPFATAGSPH